MHPKGLSGSGEMERGTQFLPSGLTCYLFIYMVCDGLGHGAERGSGFCTVLAYGRDLQSAEHVAINRVHQQGLHIVRADTATAAPWLDPVSDADYLTELARFGTALRFSLPSGSSLAATAA